jgi:hypothetical protein
MIAPGAHLMLVRDHKLVELCFPRGTSNGDVVNDTR